VEGGTVDVKANYRKVYHCLIRRLEAGRALELVVRPAGLTIINIYEVEPGKGGRGARIRHALECQRSANRFETKYSSKLTAISLAETG
jgi:hypothetical protein